MVKLLFLDVDGVLCCNSSARLEDDKLALVREIVGATQAKVVLSSDWRRDGRLRRRIVGALEEQGIQVLGATPDLESAGRGSRPEEIMAWLETYLAGRPDFVAAAHRALPVEEVAGYAVLDDRHLLGERSGGRLEGHFVRTDPAAGLTRDARRQCIQTLALKKPEGLPPPSLASESVSMAAAAATAEPASASSLAVAAAGIAAAGSDTVDVDSAGVGAGGAGGAAGGGAASTTAGGVTQ